MRTTHVVVCCLYLAIGGTSQAQQSPIDLTCKQLYRQHSYAQAGNCFSRFIPATTKGLSVSAKTRIGRRIRNAVTSYRKAAQATTSVDERAFLAERAVLLLRRYTAEALYENQFRKNSALLLSYQLVKRVGYTRVTILPGGTHDNIEVLGYQFRKVFKGHKWSGQLRQGSYHVIVVSPKRDRPYSRVLLVRPGGRVFLQIPLAAAASQPAPAKPRVSSKRSLPPQPAPRNLPMGRLAIGLLVVGGLSGMASLVFLLSSRQVEADRDALYLQEKPTNGQVLSQESIAITRQLFSWQQLATHLQTSSLITASVGGAALIGSGISLYLYLRPTTSPAPTAQSPPPSAHTLY